MFKAISRFIEGLFIGSLAGYIAGLLSAPKTGKELRKQISEESEELYKHASDTIGDIRGKTAHTMQDIQVKGEDMVKKAASNIRETSKKMSSKFDAAVTHAANSLVDDNEIIGG
jgi:gas vesicle protein